MMDTVLGLACLLCVAVAVIAMVCRQRAFAERDEVRREAREWQAAALAGESMVIDQAAENAMAKKDRDDYKRLWYASRQHTPETRDDDEPSSAIATGPRLFGDDRLGRPPRCEHED